MANKTMKSKVFTLGNRLTSRMRGDRRAAFIEAWSILKAGAIVLPVRGVMAGNRQEALRRQPMTPLMCRPSFSQNLKTPGTRTLSPSWWG
ncbi:hypothetical protein AGMMS49546_33530 [Spirochaetia bacterium]|nr:hypothetical protein AGMMS49546_33530 [Spirochaetia bacterium]